MRREDKKRRCKSCGMPMPGNRLWLCEDCQAAGMGITIRRRGDNCGRELLEVARAREHDPLEGMTPEEIACLSYMFRAPYNSYGRLRAYVYAMGELPGRQWEKGGENE